MLKNLNQINKDLFYFFDFLIGNYIGIKELSDVKAFMSIFGTKRFNEFNLNQPFIFGKISFKQIGKSERVLILIVQQII